MLAPRTDLVKSIYHREGNRRQRKLAHARRARQLLRRPDRAPALRPRHRRRRVVRQGHLETRNFAVNRR